MRTRYALAAAGLALGLFGVFRLVTQIPVADLVVLFFWLVGALIIHDGLLSPLVVTIGAGIARTIPPRARRYVQGGLVAAVAATVIAVPMIYRRNSQPPVKAILRQNFAANLAWLLAIIAVLSLVGYAIAVARSRRDSTAGRTSTVNERPSDDHSSPIS